MTNQQAINVMEKYTTADVGISKLVIEAHRMAIEALRKNADWTPVTEGLPRTDDGWEHVLVCMDDEFVCTTDYTVEEGFELWEDSGEVVAWMMPPKPFKAKNDSEEEPT